jgi:PAS domain S-box-containing protein
MFKTLLSLNYHQELVMALFASKLGPLGSGVIMPLLFAYLYVDFIPFSYLLFWLIAHLIFFSARLYSGSKALNHIDSLSHSQLQQSLKFVLFNIFGSSFLWGIASIFAITYAHTPLYLFIFFIMLSGMASASVSMLSTVFHAGFLFIMNMFFVSGVVFALLGSTQLDYFLSFSFLLYFVFTSVSSYKNYISMKDSLEQKNEIKILNQTLEKHYIELEEKAKDIEETKKEIELILESILLPVLITDKSTREILYANRYAQIQYDVPVERMVGMNIQALYTNKEQGDALRSQMLTQGYIKNLEQTFITTSGKEFIAILSVIPIKYKGRDAFIGMTTDITEQKNIEAQIRQMHKHTQDSIEYASLIQHSIIPDDALFSHFFNDYFIYWQPKDIVGGDIYLCEKVNDNEVILLVIDCTGHGVPGAFVTMLVKAVQVQVASMLLNNNFIEIDPAWILSYFNKTIKRLLKQESDTAQSNAGFDGGVIYYNKKTNLLKFAGAQTSLFYLDKENQFHTLKGDRNSVGYKKSDMKLEFNTHTLNIEKGMRFYITTDGYIDQNGGSKDFPFGKKRFTALIKEHYEKQMCEQKDIFQKELTSYQQEADRNDDITVIGFKV